MIDSNLSFPSLQLLQHRVNPLDALKKWSVEHYLRHHAQVEEPSPGRWEIPLPHPLLHHDVLNHVRCGNHLCNCHCLRSRQNCVGVEFDRPGTMYHAVPAGEPGRRRRLWRMDGMRRVVPIQSESKFNKQLQKVPKLLTRGELIHLAIRMPEMITKVLVQKNDPF